MITPGLSPLLLSSLYLDSPTSIRGKGNWSQSNDLSSELTELAEAQSLLSQLGDGIPCQQGQSATSP